ncbi:coagulation factor 5/8 type domain-containing protein [Plebeiibacterium sediminum]|uniref:Coagulation factor 5/8 type domain-containing protein n=1 Tax=Plebeiibacterium sediminum TaxID=2992112 RepID=A0AAE3SHN5_9BACT|nr:coagulation factor 5/8 type domain-containing protein [Plebeiobacterium sediminum]MCW3788283.1 coagulation factor 5/8 type domain-containing protein [Plebeiobacterium sediminum]
MILINKNSFTKHSIYLYFLLLLILTGGCNTQNKSVLSEIDFGKNVYVFSPDMKMEHIQHIADSVYVLQSDKHSEFNENRFALLFMPGEYNLNIKVGYYTSVAGLGQTPNEVIINGGVEAFAPPTYNGSVLINFWRSVENLTIVPTKDSTNVWAVSQAAPMRRVHIKGNLRLHDHGAASGGYLSDSKVDGKVDFGPQQQWFSRNCLWNSCSGGLWNIVSLDVLGAPEHQWPERPYLSLEDTLLIREKPFLALNKKNELVVKKPLQRKRMHGISWLNSEDKDYTEVNIVDFYIAHSNLDNSKSLNAALQKGKHVLFTPGIYKLNESLQVTNPETMLIGIGLPTLIPENGNAVMEIADIDGTTLSGLLVDAGLQKSETLIQFGTPESNHNHNNNPSYIFDLFVRVGGYIQGTTHNCLTINSNNVVIDHIWLWRADHGNGAGWDLNKAASGLIVNGDDVTAYGLFNEHFQEYHTVWNGENGKVFFYQSEMPYFVPSPEEWQHDGTNGYASYKVAENVNNHEVWGMGIYNVFFKSPVIVDQAVETPSHIEKKLNHITTIWLGGNESSEVRSVINGKGQSVNINNRKAVW